MKLEKENIYENIYIINYVHSFMFRICDVNRSLSVIYTDRGSDIHKTLWTGIKKHLRFYTSSLS